MEESELRFSCGVGLEKIGFYFEKEVEGQRWGEEYFYGDFCGTDSSRLY